MPPTRVATVVGVVAGLLLAGVLVTLAVQVGNAAEWTPPDRAATAPAPDRTCTNTDLALAVDGLAAAPDDVGRRLALVWRNTSTTPCLLDGFPIVDLVGPATPRFGASRYGSVVNVPRDDARPTALVVGPGETARSILRWSPPGSRTAPPAARAWTPARIVVATPGERRNQSVAWPAGPVLVGAVDDRGVTFGPLVPQ